MKQVLLLGIILAILILAMPQGVWAAQLGDPASAVVNAEITDHIALIAVFVPPLRVVLDFRQTAEQSIVEWNSHEC